MAESDYNTDSISLTSTVESEHESDDEYVVKKILSEVKIDGEKKYLVEWEGYPLHRATWEPKENLLGKDSHSKWLRLRKEMTFEKFRQYRKKKEAEFDEAVDRENHAKALRRQKRRKKRMNLKKRKREPVTSDSEDGIPLKIRKHQNPEAPTSTKQSPLPPPRDDSPQYNSLFEDSQEVNPTGSLSPVDVDDGLFVRTAPVAKRPPLIQSSSGDEEDATGQPLLDDYSDNIPLAQLSHHASEASLHLSTQQVQHDTGPNLGNSLLSPKTLQQSTTIPVSLLADKQRKVTVNSRNGPQESTRPLAVSTEQVNTEQAPPEKTLQPLNKSADQPTAASVEISNLNSADPKASRQVTTTSVGRNIPGSTAPKSKPDAVVPLSTAKPKDAASSGAITKNKPGTPTAVPSMQQSNVISLNKTATNTINEDRRQRKEWQNSERLYSTLQHRNNAAKRSRNEAMPDPRALDFVNGTPPDLQKNKSALHEDNPYGRREMGNRRIRESEIDETPRQTSTDDDGPLLPWEIHKAPQVCPAWRLSSNCPYSAKQCKFLHRNKDPDGKDYVVGDPFGWLPPKYRDPPLTCSFWFTNPAGCHKSEEDCIYAHKNTGWIPQDKMHKDTPIKIDSSKAPVFQQKPITETNQRVQQKNWKTKDTDHVYGKTCYFWANATCRYSDDECKYAHHYTRDMAPPPGGPSRENNKNAETASSHSSNNNMAVHRVNSEPNHGQDINVEVAKDGTEQAVENNAQHSAQAPYNHGEMSTAPMALVEQPRVPLSQKDLPPATTSCQLLEKRMQEALKVNIDVLFKSDDHEGNEMSFRRAILLFHPQSHAIELDLLTRWLLMHHVEVSNPWSDGCWESFRRDVGRTERGIIIAHPDFDFFSELPGFGQVLRRQVRLWSLGMQKSPEHRYATSMSPRAPQQQCVEIFPAGGLIYITDDVFEQKPRLALRIVTLFLQRTSELLGTDILDASTQDLDGFSLPWRLCVRPEFMEHLYSRCEEQTEELDAGNEDVKARAELYFLLSEKGCIEQDDQNNRPNLTPDSFAILSEQRIFAEAQPLGYFNTLSHSQEEANLQMIRYYARMQIDMCRNYRHFFIVHTEPFAPCVGQWKQEIQSIADVLSPEQCLEEFEKTGEKSVFKFEKRHTSEIEAKQVANESDVLEDGEIQSTSE